MISVKRTIQQGIHGRPEKKNLKVLNITEEGRYGGPQSRIAKVASILKDMGIETTVVCPVIDSDVIVKELTKADIPYISTRLHRMTLQLSHLIGFIMFFLPEVFSLRKVLTENKSDVIHCNGCWQIKGMIAAKLAKTGSPVIYHLNDTNTLPVIKAVFTFFARRCVDAFIPACQRSEDYYLRNSVLGGKRSFIIPAPVDTDEFHPDTVTPDAIIAKLPGVKILTVCNINYGKGLEEFIELCEVLSRRFGQGGFSFCVLGPTYKNHEAYFVQLKRKVRKKKLGNFHFLGGSNNVPGALKAADIYVCTSHFESSPMAVWEAMAMGKPVVSTDVGDVKLYFEKEHCGFCVAVGDVNDMAEKVSLLIEDKNMCTNMGKSAREFAVKNLDLRICAQRHALFYKLVATEERTEKRG